ncbi:MAG: glycosyltransferase, partial [Muribaculaceae bacterium]|nr:glycosyltransferase [Muribaculaceae bacterium]
MTIFEVMKAIVSVIIPAFNEQKNIARAIKSVLAQSFPDFELIVV